MGKLCTFEEMFEKRFPAHLKRVKTFTQLLENFQDWNLKPYATMRQREALADEARKMGLQVPENLNY